MQGFKKLKKENKDPKGFKRPYRPKRSAEDNLGTPNDVESYLEKRPKSKKSKKAQRDKERTKYQIDRRSNKEILEDLQRSYLDPEEQIMNSDESYDRRYFDQG